MRWGIADGVRQVRDDIGADGPVLGFLVWLVVAGLTGQIALLVVALVALVTSDWSTSIWITLALIGCGLPFTFRRSRPSAPSPLP